MNEINKYFEKYPNFFKNRNLRNTNSIKNFIDPSSSYINNPFDFHHMEKAVYQIVSYDKKNPIFIHGDCDTDGVSATSVLCNYLKKLDFKIFYYIPNRSIEGHSISKKSIDNAVAMGCKLMITCDIGMSCIDEIDYANNKGLRTIITDHHKPLNEYPDAISIINPWIPENKNLLFKDYSGSSVAFKLCHAINLKLTLDFKNIMDLTPIAALGVISDKVRIENENRFITFNGFQQIKKNKIKSLTSLSRKLFPYLTSIDLNRIIRVINMTTKLEDSNLAVKLLNTDISAQINSFANIIVKKYKSNQIEFNDLINNSLRIAYSQNYKSNNCIFILSDCNSAYNGAVANTISKRLNVPAIIISRMTNSMKFKGSARSISNINLFSFLDEIKDTLITMGGHPMAAGFTISENKIKIFEKKLYDYMKNKKIIRNNTLKRNVDEVIEFDEINNKFLNLIENFMPYGTGNPNPIFSTKGVLVIKKPQVVGRSQDTLEFDVEKKGFKMKCIGIGLIKYFEKLVSKNKLNIDYNIINNNDKITLSVIEVY